jgi:hypothetical protein
MNDFTKRDRANYGDQDIAKITLPKFLEETARMKEKNLAAELLRKLISEQVRVFNSTDTVQAEKFSERMTPCAIAHMKIFPIGKRPVGTYEKADERLP